MFSLFKKVPSIKVTEVDAIDNPSLIDVRSKEEYQNGHIPNAKNIVMNQLLANPSKYLMKDKTYYIVCQSGMRSKRTVKALLKEGYDVINVSGGTMSYPNQLKRGK